MSCIDESDDKWTYDDPDTWPEHFPSAGGSCQSPINIDIGTTVEQYFPPLVLSTDYTQGKLFTLTNNGHQVAVTVSKTPNATGNADLSIMGGGLDGRFDFVNFHMHWGKNDRHGSEHEIDNGTFPAEAHFVHKNKETGQIAVIAFFFDITNVSVEENQGWKLYSSTASGLKNIGDHADCLFNLSELMKIEGKRFYRYMGSLTTPPCTEGVIWTVFHSPISILEEDLNTLRENIMRKVYRPVQPLNGRTINKNQES